MILHAYGRQIISQIRSFELKDSEMHCCWHSGLMMIILAVDVSAIGFDDAGTDAHDAACFVIGMSCW